MVVHSLITYSTEPTMRANRPGYTIIGVIFNLFIISILILAVVAVPMGNQWFFQEDVLDSIRLEHPNAHDIVRTDRRIIRPSVLTVKNRDGSFSIFLLDANLLFNYDFKLVEE